MTHVLPLPGAGRRRMLIVAVVVLLLLSSLVLIECAGKRLVLEDVGGSGPVQPPPPKCWSGARLGTKVFAELIASGHTLFDVTTGAWPTVLIRYGEDTVDVVTSYNKVPTHFRLKRTDFDRMYNAGRVTQGSTVPMRISNMITHNNLTGTPIEGINTGRKLLGFDACP